jgi:dienelactone hydrolase
MVLLARLVCLSLFVSGSVVIGASHQDWNELRAQVEATLHVSRPLPGLDNKNYGRFSPAPGVDADRVSYATAYELRVPAIVYRPAGATIEQHPALVIVNGHGGDKSSWYAYWAGILYARAGAVVLTYDPIGEYERNTERRSATRAHDAIVEPKEEIGRRLAGLMLTDVMQAVAYLSQRRDVDPKRIAVLGFSMGSFVSSLACAVDTNIHACVLVGGGNLDGPGGRWDTKSAEMCERIPYQSLKSLGDRGAVLFALNAKRGPTLIYNGTADDTVDIVHEGADFFADLRKRTIAELGNSKDVFEFGFSQGTGHAPYFLTKPVALWLEEKEKFPDWTKKQIEAMPELRLSDWASTNHLPLAQSPSFLKDEGAVKALDGKIPALARDSLRAIPDAVWDAERENYVYETWVSRAREAVKNRAP